MYTRNNKTVVPVTRYVERKRCNVEVSNRFGHRLMAVQDTVRNPDTGKHEPGEVLCYYDEAGRCVSPHNPEYDLRSYVKVEKRESLTLHEKRQKGYWL